MRIEEAIELLEGVIYERNAIISYNSELPEIYIKEKVALEEAVKVLKRYNRLVQVKARPVKQHIKIQYEGEELTIKELVDRLRYALVDRDDWKELAEARYDWILELKKQLSDAQTVRHGRWITEDEYYVDDTYICSACGYEFVITDGDLESNELNYCPGCGAKMDGGEDDGQAD